jgi:N4-(beta-N-acetylglucosaminyl)-L-asparaginase
MIQEQERGQRITRFMLLCLMLLILVQKSDQMFSIVVNTWPFTNATNRAWSTLELNNTAVLDAVENGIHQCEMDQCDHSVGWGGSPDSDGNVTLDALIMCGKTRRVGAVANMKDIKPAIKVARKVMDETYHSLIVGEEATRFAEKLGFTREDLTSNFSRNLYEKWVKNGRIPNYWRKSGVNKPVGHDTIGMVAINNNMDVACGTSTNGLSFRIPGRVGDSPIAGSGAYCENGVGGCAATGNGDVIQRFLPSYYATLLMKMKGLHPRDASREALNEITKFYPPEQAYAALVCVNIKGEHGGAAIGQFQQFFRYSARDASMQDAQVFSC